MNEVAPEQITVRVDWSAVETAGQAQHVNQALASVGAPGSDGMPDGIYVTLGIVLPPPLIDADPEQRNRVIHQLRNSGARVNVAGTYHMTRHMLDDLIRVLQSTAVKYDNAVRLAGLEAKKDGPE